MDNKKGFFSVKVKIFMFVFLIILAIAVSTSAVTFYSSVDRINEYYKRCAYDNARNFASMLDGITLRSFVKLLNPRNTSHCATRQRRTETRSLSGSTSEKDHYGAVIKRYRTILLII